MASKPYNILLAVRTSKSIRASLFLPSFLFSSFSFLILSPLPTAHTTSHTTQKSGCIEQQKQNRTKNELHIVIGTGIGHSRKESNGNNSNSNRQNSLAIKIPEYREHEFAWRAPLSGCYFRRFILRVYFLLENQLSRHFKIFFFLCSYHRPSSTVHANDFYANQIWYHTHSQL